MEVDDTGAIVIVNGSSTTKAGFAGVGSPVATVPTMIGRIIEEYPIEAKRFVGSRAWELRSLLEGSFPIDRGAVVNWDDMEVIWEHIFFNELRAPPEEHPVLLTEEQLAPHTDRMKMTQIMFETFRVPAMYSMTRAELSLFGQGRISGVVVESGFGVTHVVPIFNGRVLGESVVRTKLAGGDLTDYLVKMVNERGHEFGPLELRCFSEIKEKHCHVARDFVQEVLTAPEQSFELPDGQMITIGNEIIRCPEALFHPYLLGMDSEGIHEITFNSIIKNNVDIRKELYSNVLLAGGTTMFWGFADRMQKELAALAPPNENIKVIAPPNRQHTAWIGGSGIASLSNFLSDWNTWKDYDEHGPSIVFRDVVFQPKQ